MCKVCVWVNIWTLRSIDAVKISRNENFGIVGVHGGFLIWDEIVRNFLNGRAQTWLLNHLPIMSIPRPLKELLSRLHISACERKPVEPSTVLAIKSFIRLVPISTSLPGFMSISIEECADANHGEHIIEVECLVHENACKQNVGGRMVMPSNSIYPTDFTFDPGLSVTIGVRTGELTELLHVNAEILGKNVWDPDQHVQVVFVLESH